MIYNTAGRRSVVEEGGPGQVYKIVAYSSAVPKWLVPVPFFLGVPQFDHGGMEAHPTIETSNYAKIGRGGGHTKIKIKRTRGQKYIFPGMSWRRSLAKTPTMRKFTDYIDSILLVFFKKLGFKTSHTKLTTGGGGVSIHVSLTHRPSCFFCFVFFFWRVEAVARQGRRR